MTSRKGFNLIELLAVICVVLLLGVIVVIVHPALTSHGGTPYYIACSSNLRALGVISMMYATDYDDQWFRLARQGDPHTALSQSTVSNNIRDNALGTAGMQNVWLFASGEYVDSMSYFSCPGDRTWTVRTAPEKFGWTAKTEYSYGLHWPYLKDNKGASNPAAIEDIDSSISPSEFVVMADRCPAGKTISKSNPASNHGDGSFNYLCLDGAVHRQEHKPAYNSCVGIAKDDIYTNAARMVGGIPQNPYDSSLVD